MEECKPLESGTNLFATQSLAMGIPTVSKRYGHLAQHVCREIII